MRCSIITVLLIISFSVLSQTREYEVYFDVDNMPNTGCDIAHASLPDINGIETKLTVQTQNSPPQITSSTLSTCNGNVFNTKISGIESALGFNNGDANEDVFELKTNKSDLGNFSNRNVRVYFATGSDTAEDVVIVNPNDGPIYLNFTYIIPTLGFFGLVFLILTVLAISRYQLNKTVSVMIILIAISPLVYAMTIIIDGQTDDWSNLLASASDPVGDTSQFGNHADITQVFLLQQGEEIFIRMDIVDVENSNPIITSPNSVSILENQTAVIDVQSTDPEGDTEGNGLSYSFSGGVDDSLFALETNSGVLTFINAPNFESPLDNDTNNIYEIEITVTDSFGLTDTQSISVTVTSENEAPTIVSANTANVPENQTTVIDVESTDPDGETEGAGLGYSISGGLDQVLFIIDTNSGVLSFLSAPDFENPTDNGANNVYDVQVTVTDSGALTDVQDIAITVTDVNEAPTIISAATTSVTENQTSVFDVNSTDPEGEIEEIGGLTYSITGGADSALFGIVVDTGDLTFNSAPDYDVPADNGANNVYDIQVTVTDSGALTDVQDIAITVTNINEAPIIISTAAVSVTENQTFAIDVNSTDPEGETEGLGLSYSLTGGLDLILFGIDTNSGVLTFNSAPDYENPTDNGTDNVYDVQVTVTDSSALTDVQNIAITVINENEPPIAIDDLFNTDEDTLLNGDVLLANPTSPDSDPEAGTLILTSVNGQASNLNTPISLGLGNLIVNTDGTFSFDPSNSYDFLAAGAIENLNFIYTLDDSSGVFNIPASVVITVNGVNDAPIITSTNTISIVENSVNVLDISSSDVEGETEGAGLTYSLSGGVDQALFDIDLNNGLLSFLSAPDFESPADDGNNNIYDVQVTVTDSGALTGIQDIAVTVTNENEGPIAVDDQVSTDEDTVLIGDVFAANPTVPDSDPESDSLVVTSVNGSAVNVGVQIPLGSGLLILNSNGSFSFNPNGGYESLNTGAMIIEMFTYTIDDSSGVFNVPATVNLTVNGVNDAPTITSAASVSVAENQTSAIDVNSTDPEGDIENAGLTYSITGGLDQAIFGIDNNTGELTFNNAPDFEVPTDDGINNVYDVQVTVMDSGALTDVQSIAITVTNTNEAPTIISAATASVAENQTSTLDVNSTDPEGEVEGVGGLTYIITGGADFALFGIVQTTGVLTFSSAPNFEMPADIGADNNYDVQVTVTDSGLLTDVQNITITVTNVNEAPNITSTASIIQENQTAVIDVESTDPDGEVEGVGGLQYSITGGADSLLFSIVMNTGDLAFLMAPDFEMPGDAGGNNIYDVQITVTDGDGLTDVQDIEVTVINDVVDDYILTFDTATSNTGESAPLNIVVRLNTINPMAPTLASSLSVDVLVTSGGTATSLTDFADIGTQTVTFLAGAGDGDTMNVLMTPINDANVENDETVNLLMQNVVGIGIIGTQNTHTMTIDSDDTATVEFFSLNSATVDESTPLNVGVRLNIPSGGQLEVPITANVIDATGGSATSVTDYVAFGIQPVTFVVTSINGNTQNTTLTPVDNMTPENDETVNLAVQNIGGATDASLGTQTMHVVTITDDDNTAPVANNDAYAVTGNIGISVPSGSGVLLNDSDPEMDSLSVSGFDAMSVNGGTVNVAANGSFSYSPPAGFTGSDSFTYTITDTALTDTATVTLNVSNMVWFIDNNLAAVGNGTLATPFNTLTAFATINNGAGNNPAAGACIFIDETGNGAYTGPLTLLGNQKVIGKGSSQDIPDSCGITLATHSMTLPTTSGSRPVITSATNGINLPSSVMGNTNVLRGFNIGNSVKKLLGFDFGMLTINQMDLTGSGQALDLTTGSTAVTLDSINSTNSTAEGILLDGITGSFTVSGLTSIDRATDFSISINRTSATYSFANVNVNNRLGAGISITANNVIQNGSFGIVTIRNQITVPANNTNSMVITNTPIGSNIVVNYLDTDDNNQSSTGLNVNNHRGLISIVDGIINMSSITPGITYTGNSGNMNFAADVTSTFGPSMFVSSNSGGMVNFTGNITDSGSGIDLRTNSGTTINFTGVLNLSPTFFITAERAAFRATGGGTVNVTGVNNVINTTTKRAINITNTTIGASGVSFRSVSVNGAVNGILLDNTGSLGTFSVTGDGGSTIIGGNNSGGQIQNTTLDAIILTNTNNISFRDIGVSNSTISHINATMVNNLILDEMNFNSSDFHGINGSSISNLTLSNSLFDLSGNAANEHGFSTTNLLGSSNFTNNQFTRSSTIHLFVQNTSTFSAPDVINLLNNSFSMPVAGTFGDNVSIEAGSTANIDLNIGDSSLSNSNTFTGGQDGVQAFTATGGQLNVSINNNSASNLTGVGFNIGGFNSSTIVYDIQNNTVNNIGSTGINTISIGGANLDGQLINNNINGSTAGQGIQVITEGNGNIRSLVQGNDIDNIDAEYGIRAQARAGSGRIDITIVNNDVNLSASPFPLEGIYIESGSSAGGDTNTVCLDLRNNTSVSNFNEGYRVRHRPGTTFDLENFAGVGSNPADIITHINTTNSNTGTIQVTGTGFTTSPACAMPVL